MKIVQTIFKVLLLFVVIGYIVYAIGWLGHSSDDMICSGITMNINDEAEQNFISEEDILGILHKEHISVKGQKIGDIDMRDIEQRIKSYDFIDSVCCYHTANGKLSIDIIPMQPVLHIMAENGEDYYLDKTGTPISSQNLNADLCIVTGKVNRKFASAQLVALGNFLQANDYWNNIIQQINISDGNTIELIPSIGNHTLVLGDTTKMEDKFERFRLFYEKGLPKCGWNLYDRISAEYDGQLVCKLGRKRIEKVLVPITPAEVNAHANAASADNEQQINR